jgi:TetR/AcrR family fatty acid metabolism transcriptional regulator
MKKEREKFFRILDAAVRVFAQKGFFKARISDIAKEAGVADGTVYLYFKNKDDILIQVFEVNLDRILKELHLQLSVLPGPLEKLERWFRYQVELFQSNKELVEVLIVEIRQSRRFMKEYTPNLYFAYLDILGSVLKEGKEEGVFVETLDANILKYAIYGAVEEVALRWVLKGGAFDISRAIDGLFLIWLEGIAYKKGAAFLPEARNVPSHTHNGGLS